MTRIRGDLPERTFEFAVRAVRLHDGLPRNTKGIVFGRQLVRSATSIGANVREADEAVSDREFVQRCSIARKEASEAQYWLELCRRCSLLRGEELDALIDECLELRRILSSIVRKSQGRDNRRSTRSP